MTFPKQQTLAQILNFRSFILAIILAVIVYLAILVISGWDELINNLFQVNIYIIILAMILSFTNYVFRFFKWHLFTQSLEMDIPIKKNFYIFLAGLSLAISPAKVGEAIRAFLLQHTINKDLSKGLASTFSERLIDLLAVTLLALIGAIILGFKESILYLPVLVIILLGIIIGFIIFLFDRLYNFFSRIFHIGPWSSLGKKIDQFRYDVIITFRCKVFFAALGFGIIGWACEGIGFYLIAQNLGILMPLEVSIFIYATSSLLGALSFLPGGLGVTEGSMEVFLADFLQITLSLASALIILIRLTTLWFGVIVGLVFLYLVTKRFPKSNVTNSEDIIANQKF